MSEAQLYSVEIFAPARRDFEGAELIDFFKLRENLRTGFGIPYTHRHGISFEIKASVGDAPLYAKELLNNRSFQLYGIERGDSEFFSISCSSVFDKKLIKKYIKSYPGKTEAEYEEIFVNHFVSTLSEIFDHIVVCMNISSPGIFYCGDGASFVNGKFFRRNLGSFHTIENCAFSAKEFGLPIVRELEFKDCWSLYSTLNGSFINLSSTKLERSVAYFARLFRSSHASDVGSNLIWAVSGIEALIAEGDRGIERQIRERLKALIPGLFLDIFDTKIKDMYQVRSRILHGQFNFSISEYSDRWSSSPEYTKIREAEDMAMLILIFIIQYCFSRRSHEINFQTVILP